MMFRTSGALRILNQNAVIPALETLRKEDQEFKTRLHSEFPAWMINRRPCLKKHNRVGV